MFEYNWVDEGELKSLKTSILKIFPVTSFGNKKLFSEILSKINKISKEYQKQSQKKNFFLIFFYS